MARPKKKERRYRIAESQTGETDCHKSNTTFGGKALFMTGNWNCGSPEPGTIVSPAAVREGFTAKVALRRAMTS